MSKIRLKKLSLGVLSVASVMIMMSCRDETAPSTDKSADTSDKRAAMEEEYQLTQLELALANTAKSYLVFDMPANKIEIRLKGAVVWEYPITLDDDEDSAAISAFGKAFYGGKGQLLRPITDKYLFEASDKTSDSVLAIIADAVNANPSLLQRKIPEHFFVDWGDGLKLYIRSNVTGTAASPLKNTYMRWKDKFKAPFGETYLHIKLEPEGALTLYRVAEKGYPTLLIPKH